MYRALGTIKEHLFLYDGFIGCFFICVIDTIIFLLTGWFNNWMTIFPSFYSVKKSSINEWFISRMKFIRRNIDLIVKVLCGYNRGKLSYIILKVLLCFEEEGLCTFGENLRGGKLILDYGIVIA